MRNPHLITLGRTEMDTMMTLKVIITNHLVEEAITEVEDSIINTMIMKAVQGFTKGGVLIIIKVGLEAEEEATIKRIQL